MKRALGALFLCVIVPCALENCCLGPKVKFPADWTRVAGKDEEAIDITSISSRVSLLWKEHLEPSRENPISGQIFVDGSPFLISHNLLVYQKGTDLIFASEESGQTITQCGNVLPAKTLGLWEVEKDLGIMMDISTLVVSHPDTTQNPCATKVSVPQNCVASKGVTICSEWHWGWCTSLSAKAGDTGPLWELRPERGFMGRCKPWIMIFLARKDKLLVQFEEVRSPDNPSFSGYVNFYRAIFRAYDLHTGHLLWEAPLEPAVELHSGFWMHKLKTLDGGSLKTILAVIHDRLFLTLLEFKDGHPELLFQGTTWCLDLEDGKVLWQSPGRAWYWEAQNPSMERPFYMFRTGNPNELFSIDPKSGRVLQKYSFENTPPPFETYLDERIFPGNTILLYETQTTEKKGLLALDMTTAEKIWSVPYDEKDGVPVFGDNTVIVGNPKGPRIQNGGKARLYSSLDLLSDHLTAYDERSGKVLWKAKVIGGKTSRIVGITAKGKRAFVRTASGWLYAITWD